MSRPVLYDAQLLNHMIADVDRIDPTSIGTHAINTNNNYDQDNIELNAERKDFAQSDLCLRCALNR